MRREVRDTTRAEGCVGEGHGGTLSPQLGLTSSLLAQRSCTWQAYFLLKTQVREACRQRTREDIIRDDKDMTGVPTAPATFITCPFVFARVPLTTNNNKIDWAKLSSSRDATHDPRADARLLHQALELTGQSAM